MMIKNDAPAFSTFVITKCSKCGSKSRKKEKEFSFSCLCPSCGGNITITGIVKKLKK
ncbi:MAG: hypothetical protein ISR65_16405 [Bacteriovoracaceae bacterium]|nr:hypothetical protein [Bacteriovoracaceae bacterium]